MKLIVDGILYRIFCDGSFHITKDTFNRETDIFRCNCQEVR